MRAHRPAGAAGFESGGRGRGAGLRSAAAPARAGGEAWRLERRRGRGRHRALDRRRGHAARHRGYKCARGVPGRGAGGPDRWADRARGHSRRRFLHALRLRGTAARALNQVRAAHGACLSACHRTGGDENGGCERDRQPPLRARGRSGRLSPPCGQRDGHGEEPDLPQVAAAPRRIPMTIIGIDLGTFAIKAVLVDGGQQVLDYRPPGRGRNRGRCVGRGAPGAVGGFGHATDGSASHPSATHPCSRPIRAWAQHMRSIAHCGGAPSSSTGR